MLDHPTSRMPAVAIEARHQDRRRPLEPTPAFVTRTTVDDGQPSRSRRLAQVALIAVLGAVAAGIAISLPDDEAGQQVASGSTTRVEADGPTASASLLASDGRLEVEGELTDTGQMAQRSGLTIQLREPSGTVALDATEITDLIEPSTGLDPAAAPKESTTTTTPWVEPSLPAESEWVDTGNGVLVPDLLLRIRFCESTNDYKAASPYSTARGAYQFLSGSWEWYGHAERTGVTQAHLASPAQQDQAALRTLQAEGTAPWSESRPCWNNPDIDPRYATASPPTTAGTTTTTETTASTGSTETTVESTTTTTDPSSSTTTEPSTTSTTEPTTPSTSSSTPSTAAP